ncbi:MULTISPECIES: hypothetical protein [Myxococcus]|nr:MULTISPECIES: hypothetical protein [Myxococcus]NOJ52929.1 hypothetical protein [Myxococcus xanthus]
MRRDAPLEGRRFYLGLLALGLLVPLVLFGAGAVNRFAASQREARAQVMRETARAGGGLRRAPGEAGGPHASA